MDTETGGEPKRIVRSPGFDGSRPISLRHLSSDLVSYIDMYGAKPEDHENGLVDGQKEVPGFLSSTNVAAELENIRNLRRLSMNDSKVDPDVPAQNYEVASSIESRNSGTDDDLGDSSFWVPARIHPELAPQEWQSFVQKKNGTVDSDMFSGGLRNPSIKRGLSRSKSLLSREVSDRASDRYTDAGPELERRRSRLRPQLDVKDLGTLIENDDERGRNQIITRSPSGSSQSKASSGSDEPILVPPPGQILRRAARTGKAKSSYRKLGRAKTPDLSLSDSTQSNSPPIRPDGTQYFESEEIQLRDDAPRDRDSSPTVLTPKATEPQVERTKSRNRTIQVVGPRSSPIAEEGQFDSSEHMSENSTSPSFDKADIDIGRGNRIEDGVRPSPSAKGHLSKLEIPDLENVRDEPLSAASNRSTHEDGERYHDSISTKDGVKAPEIESSENSVIPGSSVEKRESHNDVSQDINITPAARPARPVLKRELSAASLTRAVMNGTAPAPPKTSPPRRTPNEHAENELDHVISNSSSNSAPTKKSAWGKLFSSDEKDRAKVKKDAKVGSKMKRTPSQEETASSEKDSVSTNLFTSIFGGGRKKEKEPSEVVRRESAPVARPVVREPHFYSRYPIQLERAIYRMAHLKLGNSRRPLAHQVLLSNFMYGYLALVGANASGQSQGPSARSRSPVSAQRTNHRRGADTGEHQRRSSPVRHKSPSSMHRAPTPKREDGVTSTTPTAESYSPSSTSSGPSHGTTNTHESIPG